MIKSMPVEMPVRCPWSRPKRPLQSCTAPARWKCWWTMRSLSRNLTKMAQQKGYLSSSEKLAEQEYRVRFTIKDTPAAETAVPGKVKQQAEAETCIPDARTDTVVVIASDKMGEGAGGAGQDPGQGLRVLPDPAGQAAQDDPLL